MVLNRRLPGITARGILPIVRWEIVNLPNGPTDLTRVETFPGAARLKRFAVMHAPRQICWGLLRAIQSDSPPDGGRRQRYTNESAAKSRPKIFEAGAFIQRFSTVEYTSLKSTVWIRSPWSSVPKEGWFP
jgi:hypothetical protein